MLNTEGTFFAQKSKLIIGILCGILIIIVIGIGVVYKTIPKKTTSTSPTEEFVLPTELPLPTHVTNPIIPTTPPTPISQPGDIILDGIPVRNFKEKPVRTESNGDTVLAETSEYQILFSESEQKFILVIFGANFTSAQQKAENTLLQALGIDELNICRLYIEEEVPASVKNEHSGKVYPLSFCVHDHDP